MTGRARKLAGPLVALTLLAAGCASDGGSAATTSTLATSTSTPTPDTTAPSGSSVAGAPPTTPAGSSDASTPATTPGTGTSTGTSATSTSTVASVDPSVDPTIAVETVASFDQPVDIAWRANDTAAYVVQQGGLIVPLLDGAPGDPVLDISSLTRAGGERGLLGLTFSPDGAFAYIDYTDVDGNTVIAEYPVLDDGSFDESAARIVLRIDQPYANHNGGNVMFGPDGYLYIGMGDGGAGGDPERRALDTGELLGKILRIDPTPGDGTDYTIPADNPFVDVDGARPEIWAIGVRNPFRMSFDAATADLWFGDVGQDAWEEIDHVTAADGAGRGMDFGWSAYEGTHRYNDDQTADDMTPPVYEYAHGDAGCSVTGGAVYRGTAVPDLTGWYVFGDYCSGQVTGIRPDGASPADTLLLGNVPALSSIRTAPDGELYATSVNGDVIRFVAG